MKGLILAGGTGSRMYPVTRAVNKHLLPVFDKPMIFYPLSVLMLAEIREVGIVCRKCDVLAFKSILGSGQHLGIKIEYIIQHEAKGIADGIKLAKTFIGNSSFCAILGDNFFFGPGLTPRLLDAKKQFKTATAFAYQVKNPKSFGVISYNNRQQVDSIEEKPEYPKSNTVATGLYMFDSFAFEYIDALSQSARGELEVTDLLNKYVDNKVLNVEVLGRGYAWLDMGTNENLMEASIYIQSIEKRQGFKIACLEEIALQKKWISKNEVKTAFQNFKQTAYGEYLNKIIQEEI